MKRRSKKRGYAGKSDDGENENGHSTPKKKAIEDYQEILRLDISMAHPNAPMDVSQRPTNLPKTFSIHHQYTPECLT